MSSNGPTLGNCPAITDGKEDNVNHALPSASRHVISEANRTAEDKENALVTICKKIGKMNFLLLFWDSKIPENKTGLFSLKISNPMKMTEEIEKLQEFYAEMKTAVQIISKGDREGMEEVEILVDDLYGKLEILAKTAAIGKVTTDSKIVHHLYQEFALEHVELENKIRSVESVALRQKQRLLRLELTQAMDEIKNLTKMMTELKEDNLRMRDSVEKLSEDASVWRDECQRARQERKEAREERKIARLERERAKTEEMKAQEERRKMLDQMSTLAELFSTLTNREE